MLPFPAKRILILASEVGVLVFGCVFTLALVLGSANYFRSREPFDYRNGCLLLLIILFGLLPTSVGFMAIRRTRPWKPEYDSAAWALARAKRRLHPTRARYKRIALRIIVWVPSMIAALVLFFFPVATHLLHPSSKYFTHYRVPIPWTFTVFQGGYRQPANSWVDVIFSSSGRGRFGMTPFPMAPFWHELQPISHVVFESNTNGDTFDYSGMMEARRRGATDVLNRELRLGDVACTCWQYRPERPHHQLFWPDIWSVWRVDCGTLAAVHRQNFYARFSGREEDLRAFYQIIEGVRPVE